MITKELVDFVKKMRLERHIDTEIMSMLVANGWLSMDVMEAFHAIDGTAKNIQVPPAPPTPPIVPSSSPQMPPEILSQINNLQPINVGMPKDIGFMPKEKEKSKSHRGLIAFFVILFFVLVLVVSGYFYQDNLKNLPVIKNFFLATEAPQAVTEIPEPVVPAVSAVLNCVNNIDCFIKAAENNCQLAKVDYSTSIPLPFFNSPEHPNLIMANGTRYFEIQGKENDNCIFYEKVTNSSVTLNQTELDKITDLTVKDKADSAKLIDTMNKSASSIIGRDAVCKVTPLEFKNKTDKDRSGDFSFSFSADLTSGESKNLDPYAAKCTGEIYHPKAGVPVTHADSNCTLRTSTDQFVVGINVTMSGLVKALYYKGTPEQISWVSKDPSIITITPNSGDGSSIKFKGVTKGSTSILVTDNAVGSNCNVTVNASSNNFLWD